MKFPISFCFLTKKKKKKKKWFEKKKRGRLIRVTVCVYISKNPLSRFLMTRAMGAFFLSYAQRTK
jgi:hypothetical protein